MNCGIYKITNLTNNKVYIGQSVNIKERFRHHRRAIFDINSPSYNYPLYKAIRKYGLDNFEFSIIENVEQLYLNDREKYWINYYHSNNRSFGYNQTEGGQSATTKTLSYEDVDKIINLLTNTQFSQNEIAQIFGVSQMAISDINTGKFWHKDYLSYPLRKQNKTIKYCSICGINISSNAKHCSKCKSLLERRATRPNRDELKKLIRENSFVSVGKMFDVSDNAIRKWCKTENLPYKKSEIMSYSQEEWENI